MKTGWNRNTLGCICDIYNGNSINAEYKKKHYAGLTDGYPFIATKDVSFDGKINYDNGVRIPYDTQYKTADKGSVFICAEGGSAGRKIALIRETVCFGNKLFCLKPKKHVQGNFLYLYLRSDDFQSQFKEKLSGLIGGVSAKKLNDIKISYPALSEQQDIVDKINVQFSKIDKLKQNAEKELQEVLSCLKTTISQATSFRNGWNLDTLGELSTIKGDYGLAAPSRPYDISKNDFRYLRITDITEWGELNDDIVAADIDSDIKQKPLAEGDILFARTGATVGKTLIYRKDFGDCLFAGYLIRYRLDHERILPRYMFYVTHSDIYYKWVAQKQKVAAQPNISAKLYNQYPIAYPSVEEQKVIISDLDHIFSKVMLLQTSYDKITKECEALKQSILREIFD